MNRRWPILVVDDEEVMRVSLAAWLSEDGWVVDTASSGREAVARAAEREYAACFVDLKMPGGLDGIETMREIHRLRPDAVVIIVTAYATVDTAVAALKAGAQEYIVKPCNPEEISLLVGRIVKVKRLERENRILRNRLAGQHRFGELTSKSPRMAEIFLLVQDVANLRSTVLIQGESGTGKELIARAIHGLGSRATRPFIPVACAALPESLLEAELFGHEKGSFTGASERRKGKFELADGGSILLDEIGEVSARVQVELLRVLQERRFFRIGGSEEVAVDVRVIAASNADLRRAVAEGRFREDLFYRLNVVTITVPPLRERTEDIPLLARELLEQCASEVGKEVHAIEPAALARLMEHPWPGNVRELQNAIERAVVTCRGEVLGEEDFAFLVRERPPSGWAPPTDRPLAEVEREVILATLDRLGGNVKRTAEVLGIDRSTLYDRLKRYGVARV